MAIYKTLVKKASISPDAKIKQKDYCTSGLFPVIDQGKETIGGYSNDESKVLQCKLPAVVFGDHTRTVKYIEFPFCAGADGIKVLIPIDGVLPKYLFYGTQYLSYKMPDRGYARHYQFIEKMNLPLPELDEQKRIVACIEELFSELDAGVETLQKIKQQLSVYRQTVLSEILLKEVKRFPYTEYALKDIVEKDGGLRRGPFGGSIKKQCFVPAGYKVYEQGNAINDSVEYGHYFISEEKYQEMKGFQIKPFDLLVSCSGTLGRITELPWNAPKGIINQALLRIRINRDIVESEYFIQYFRAGFFQKKIVEKSQGSAMQNLVSIKEFKEIKLAIPQKKYQKHITELVSEKLSCCDSIEKKVDEALQRSAAMRQSILKQAFEGGL